MNVMQRKTGNAGEVLHVDSVPVPEIVAAVIGPPKKKQEQRKSLWNMLLRRLGRPGLVSSASKHGGSRFNNNGELRLFFSDDCIDAKT